VPLQEGKSKKTISKNIKEMMEKYKRSGSIGSTNPKSTSHAQEIASAIAYNKARENGAKLPKKAEEDYLYNKASEILKTFK